MNQVVLYKKVSIKRSIAQARKYYAMKGELPFEEHHLKQDAVALNVQRACELCIDIANHLIRTRKLGLPQDSKDSFSLLQRAGLIDEALAAALRAMVGFRNILLHQYQRLDLDIMLEVVEHLLDDLLACQHRLGSLGLNDGLA